MKLRLLVFICVISSLTVYAQEGMSIKPFSSVANIAEYEKYLPEEFIIAPSLSGIEQEDVDRDNKGEFYRIAKHVDVNITLNNTGVWSTLPTGDKVWRLKLTSQGAQGTLLFFNDFYLPKGARFHIYSPDKKQILGAFTSYNNDESKSFATAIVKGETCVLEYYEPIEESGKGVISINEFGYVYRAANIFDELDENDSQLGPNETAVSDICEVDVKCPEGTAWANQIRGICRILVKVGTSSGYCSGSAINNTNDDCTSYILTAQHCGVSGTTYATTADFNAWKFYFNYQKSGCGTGSGTSSNVLTGAALMSNSNDVSGSSITKSDFILVKTNTAFPASFNIYLNGWNNVNTGSPSGVGIHHPAGDYKKISTYTATATSSGWSSVNTHWQVKWVATATNWGVTEGGSSGSPLFNNAGLIVGQLSGGSSYCDGGVNDPSSTQVNQDDPDVYGKFSYSWITCGSTSNRQLKPWLDPLTTGVTSLVGRDNTCTIGMKDIEIENIFSIYPNPVNDVLIIDATGFNETIHTIYIYDQLGKLILTSEIQPGRIQKSIAVNSFENGVYSIVISNGERSFNRKFVKL